jgi:glutamate-1-semialdehyde 2,1-aminomutase
MLERARQSLTGGVSSPFRAKFPVPLYFKDARGPRAIDVDGNEYIDYALAWGPLILGHVHPKLVEAVARQAGKPHCYGAQHELEFALSEKMRAMVPCAERVAFTSSGSEAVQAVLRLARAYTGRNLILKFEGNYHGWLDSVLLSYRGGVEDLGSLDDLRVHLNSKGQVPNSVENVVVAPWNDIDRLKQILEKRGHEIAAVITEPVVCNSGSLMPRPGFLESLRTLTQECGALLIFDEIITGFRMAPGGAQSVFGVTPDMATFGKALGGGLPISAFAGRTDVMEMMVTGGVAYGGTFNGNPLSLAAALATLEELSAHDGAALIQANHAGQAIAKGIAAAGAEYGLPVIVTGFGAAISVHFTKLSEVRSYRDYLESDQQMLTRYLRGILDEGIYLLPDGRMYVSAVHTEREVDQTVEAARKVFARMAA